MTYLETGAVPSRHAVVHTIRMRRARMCRAGHVTMSMAVIRHHRHPVDKARVGRHWTASARRRVAQRRSEPRADAPRRALTMDAGVRAARPDQGGFLMDETEERGRRNGTGSEWRAEARARVAMRRDLMRGVGEMCAASRTACAHRARGAKRAKKRANSASRHLHGVHVGRGAVGREAAEEPAVRVGRRSGPRKCLLLDSAAAIVDRLQVRSRWRVVEEAERWLVHLERGEEHLSLLRLDATPNHTHSSPARSSRALTQALTSEQE